ncbi:MAG: hypothetical protein JW973_08720 [Bacteroidales bacterium]|nr:hypothetical protein [Bacteroidales bacterium]
MKKLALSAFWILFGTSMLALAMDKIPDNLLSQFKSADWPAVLKAKEKIENMEGAGIPQLMSLLDDFSVRRLKNTGDLIYPGTKKFYGHGQIVTYDIDEICIRAGWLLEDLSFQSFGFSGIHLPDNELNDFIRNNFAEYYNRSGNRQEFENMSANEKRKLIRSLSIKAAQTWWNKKSENWNRLDALVDALKSDNEKCQVKALFYMRNGKTRCSGLTREFYKTNLESVVRILAKDDLKRISENAKLILMDIDFEWITMKSVRQG